MPVDGDLPRAGPFCCCLLAVNETIFLKNLRDTHRKLREKEVYIVVLTIATVARGQRQIQNKYPEIQDKTRREGRNRVRKIGRQ